MKDFTLCTDIETVIELLNISAKELADSIGVTPTTISRWRKDEEQASTTNLNAFYNFAFRKGIRLNKIKEQLFKEDCGSGAVILFKGPKHILTGEFRLKNRKAPMISAEVFTAGKA